MSAMAPRTIAPTARACGPPPETASALARAVPASTGRRRGRDGVGDVEEVQDVAADDDLVAVGQRAPLDALAVDEHAVEAAVVEHAHARPAWRTISAWRRETVGSSKRTSAARLRPIRVHSRESGVTTQLRRRRGRPGTRPARRSGLAPRQARSRRRPRRPQPSGEARRGRRAAKRGRSARHRNRGTSGGDRPRQASPRTRSPGNGTNRCPPACPKSSHPLTLLQGDRRPPPDRPIVRDDTDEPKPLPGHRRCPANVACRGRRALPAAKTRA